MVTRRDVYASTVPWNLNARPQNECSCVSNIGPHLGNYGNWRYAVQPCGPLVVLILTHTHMLKFEGLEQAQDVRFRARLLVDFGGACSGGAGGAPNHQPAEIIHPLFDMEVDKRLPKRKVVFQNPWSGSDGGKVFVTLSLPKGKPRCRCT